MLEPIYLLLKHRLFHSELLTEFVQYDSDTKAMFAAYNVIDQCCLPCALADELWMPVGDKRESLITLVVDHSCASCEAVWLCTSAQIEPELCINGLAIAYQRPGSL